MSGEWLVTKHGKKLGPYSHSDVCKFIKLGHIEPNDRLWRKGQKGRLPASTLFLSAFDVRTVAQLRSKDANTYSDTPPQTGSISEQRSAPDSTRRGSRMGNASFSGIENASPSRFRFLKISIYILSVFIFCGAMVFLFFDWEGAKTQANQDQDFFRSNVNLEQIETALVVSSPSVESVQTII